jgi:tRNA A-37 threonylcarbamoyl transferase component Bud32
MDRIGRYKIVRELGRGAMGVVYHAIDPNIGRPVAIKTIHLGVGRKPEEQERLRERLLREARSAGILSHPGIVTIYDVEHQGEVAYIAMEYVDGPTLDHVLSERATIPPSKLFSVLSQTAAALDYAHQKGIVHRDIKPANIMIAADGTCKITDFGIAKITASDQFTMTGAIVGTPHYMSPEQVQGHSVDGRSDQFSLAVIAYEALTGEKPYTGEHLTTVVYKIVTEEPPPPHHLNPSLSGPIDTVLRKALAKKPDARFSTCQEFVETLEKACAATKGWRLMSRGGTLNEPTVADTAAITLPRGVKPSRLGDTTLTAARGGRKGGFLTFLLAALATAGLIALIALDAPPWLSSLGKQTPAEDNRVAKSSEPVQPAPKEEPPKAPPPVAEATPGDAKPSALAPPAAQDSKQATTEPPRRQARAQTTTSVQPIIIISSPGGAKAMLDNRADAICTTPCSVDAAPGRHLIAVSLDGFQPEHREVDVGTSPVELPAVILRAAGGTLMLTSIPNGATVLVDGKPTGKTTPTQLTLPPGSYKITVEHEGRQVTQTVQLGTGLSYLKITM